MVKVVKICEPHPETKSFNKGMKCYGISTTCIKLVPRRTTVFIFVMCLLTLNFTLYRFYVSSPEFKRFDQNIKHNNSVKWQSKLRSVLSIPSEGSMRTRTIRQSNSFIGKRAAPLAKPIAKVLPITIIPRKQLPRKALLVENVSLKESPMKIPPLGKLFQKEPPKKTPPIETVFQNQSPKKIPPVKNVLQNQPMKKVLPVKKILPFKNIPSKKTPKTILSFKNIPPKEPPKKKVQFRNFSQKEPKHVPQKEHPQKRLPFNNVQQQEDPKETIPLMKFPQKEPPKKMLPSKNISQKDSSKKVDAPNSFLNGRSPIEQTKTSSIMLGPVLKYYQLGHTNSSTDICKKEKKIKLLIIITSALTHKDARMAIRLTWGHYTIRRDVTIAFLMGTTTEEKLRTEVTEEQNLYGDIIIGNFIDSYLNLTLKTVSMLEWVRTNCLNANFVLKTDDDMFINVPSLLDFIFNLNINARVIYGKLGRNLKPFRNRESKYYVSHEEFKPSVYPQFTTGPAYLFPSKLSVDLFTASLMHPFFKLEDVFLTGIVAEDLGIRRVHVPQFHNVKAKLTACTVQKKISIHQIKPHQQFEAWNILLGGLQTCK